MIAVLATIGGAVVGMLRTSFPPLIAPSLPGGVRISLPALVWALVAVVAIVARYFDRAADDLERQQHPDRLEGHREARR